MKNKPLKLSREEDHGAKNGKGYAKETRGVIEDVRCWFMQGEHGTILTVKGKGYIFQAAIPARIGDGVILHWFYSKKDIEGIQLLNDKNEVCYRYHEPDGASWLNTYFTE